MGFWSFIGDMLLFNWLFGRKKPGSGDEVGNHVVYRERNYDEDYLDDLNTYMDDLDSLDSYDGLTDFNAYNDDFDLYDDLDLYDELDDH